MIEVLLVLLTVIAVTAAVAMAPGRLRSRVARRRSSGRGAPGSARRARQDAFLAVCSACLEMVETDAAVARCPACGAELAVRRRIRPSRGRARANRAPRTTARR